MEESVCRDLFNALHPGFFERPHIRAIPEEEVFDEMLLDLSTFDVNRYHRNLPQNISFGYFDGDLVALRDKVAQVEDGWVRYFDADSRVYCGFVENEVASFCIIEDYGTFNPSDLRVSIGGPGCVGTLPEYRNHGIGLTMVSRVTQILKDEGFDYSYLHYTYIPEWYRKIGYITILRWNSRGFLGSWGQAHDPSTTQKTQQKKMEIGIHRV